MSVSATGSALLSCFSIIIVRHFKSLRVFLCLGKWWWWRLWKR